MCSPKASDGRRHHQRHAVRHGVHGGLLRPPGSEGEVDLAAGVAEVGAAFGLVDGADGLLQRLGEAAQLGAEAAIVLGDDLAQPASAEFQLPVRQARPVHREDPHLGVIPQPGAQFGRVDGAAVE